MFTILAAVLLLSVITLKLADAYYRDEPRGGRHRKLD